MATILCLYVLKKSRTDHFCRIMKTSSNGNIFRVTGFFVRGIHWSPVDYPHNGQWRGTLMFSLICVWTNGWANNRDAGDLRRYLAHYDVTVMFHHSTVFFRYDDRIISSMIDHWKGKSRHSDYCVITVFHMRLPWWQPCVQPVTSK